jgi:hypothetical protein
MQGCAKHFRANVEMTNQLGRGALEDGSAGKSFEDAALGQKECERRLHGGRGERSHIRDNVRGASRGTIFSAGL